MKKRKAELYSLSECERSPARWTGAARSWEWGRKRNLPVWTEFVLCSHHSAGWSYTHFNPSQYAFEIPVQGELTIAREDYRITIAPGEVYLLPSGEYNRLEAAEFCGKWSVGLCGSALNTFIISLFRDHRHFVVGNPDKLLAVLKKLHPLLQARDPASVPQVSALAVEFMMELATSVPSELPALLADAVRIMEFNLATSVRIDRIAAELKLSEYQLGKLFRTYYNCTPKSYLIRLRMERAAQLLQESCLTVKAVSWQLGYSTGLLFSREFHKYYGMSPREYRKRVENRSSGFHADLC